MRQIVSATCGLWLGLAGAAAAQGVPGVVVELFTSQGCSSCPPADAFMEELATQPGVIALSLHVDYWDYIGWKDSFAKPQYTERQKAYARFAGSRTIYTPQMIVGGQDRVEGNQPETVANLVRQHMAGAPEVGLTLERSDGRLKVKAWSDRPLSGTARVQVVRYIPEKVVAIESGENAGQTVTYRNIVTDWKLLGEWPGTGPFEAEAELSGDEPVVVIVQSDGPSDILAASRLD